jgi:hypothetical protein
MNAQRANVLTFIDLVKIAFAGDTPGVSRFFLIWD